MLKIVVKNKNGNYADISHSFFRYLILSFIIFSSGIGQSIYSITNNFDFLLSFFPIIQLFFFISVIGLLLFNKEKRGLHDYLSKTIVVKQNIEEENTIPEIRKSIRDFCTFKLSLLSGI